MPERTMESFVWEVLTGETQKNALDFAAFLRANDMVFVRGGGYWEDI